MILEEEMTAVWVLIGILFVGISCLGYLTAQIMKYYAEYTRQLEKKVQSLEEKVERNAGDENAQ